MKKSMLSYLVSCCYLMNLLYKTIVYKVFSNNERYVNDSFRRDQRAFDIKILEHIDNPTYCYYNGK